MKNKYIRNNFEGLTSEVFDWECLSLSSFLKEEFRIEIAEKELISAYVNAFEILFEKFNNERKSMSHIKLLKDDQTCIPILYLCRHALELTIKLVIFRKSNNAIKGHKLNYLWEKLKETVNIIEDYDILIETINYLDSDGAKLRYIKDCKNNEYNTKPIFIKLDSLVDDTKKLISYLINLI